MKAIHPIKPPPVATLKDLHPHSASTDPRTSIPHLLLPGHPVPTPLYGPLIPVESEEVSLTRVVELVAAEEVAEAPGSLVGNAGGEGVEAEVGAVIFVLVFPGEAGVVVVGVLGGVVGEADGGRGGEDEVLV